MYGHYLITSLKIWKPWWKRHLTELQIIQFITLLAHMSQLWWVEDCGFPKPLSFLLIPQLFVMLWMFSSFYYQAYAKKPAKARNIEDSKKMKSQKQKDN